MPDQLHLPTPPAAPKPGAPEPTDQDACRQRLREALRDPALRAIESFPIGSDKAIPADILTSALNVARFVREATMAAAHTPPDT